MTGPNGANRGRRIAIAGGGIGGLTAALCFARSGAEVTVLEQAPALTEVGAGLQITPNGARVFDALGLGPALDQASVRAEAVRPMDGRSGATVARFDLGQLGGPPYRFVHRADLIALLAAACDRAGVLVRTGCPVASIAPEGDVALTTGEALAPDLAVGADGLHSVLRPALNGAAEPFFTGQAAWRAVVRREAIPEARIWMLPRRHVVTYPLTGGRMNIVAVQEQAEWTPEGWHHADAPEALQAVFADACTELRAILRVVREVRLWGLFRHTVAQRWHGSASAILGDAAHPTLPFLAQGANLAVEDAWVLAACCDAGVTLAEGLARYQALRRDRVVRAITAANANAANYHLAGARRLAAHAGLRAVARLAPGAFLRRLDWLYGHDVTAG